MRKNVKRSLKWIILAFSLIMFFYQAQIAVKKLLNPPVVDSTDILNIADIDPPLITICQKDQFSHQTWGKMGYFRINELLLGNDAKNNITAWGSQYNMTFEEIVDEIVDFDKDYPKLKFKMDNGPWWKVDYERRFYPRHGRCFDFANYTITGDLAFNIVLSRINFFSTGPSSPEAEVYLTDKKLRTRNTVHKHTGDQGSAFNTMNTMNTWLKLNNCQALIPENQMFVRSILMVSLKDVWMKSYRIFGNQLLVATPLGFHLKTNAMLY